MTPKNSHPLSFGHWPEFIFLPGKNKAKCYQHCQEVPCVRETECWENRSFLLRPWPSAVFLLRIPQRWGPRRFQPWLRYWTKKEKHVLGFLLPLAQHPPTLLSSCLELQITGDFLEESGSSCCVLWAGKTEPRKSTEWWWWWWWGFWKEEEERQNSPKVFALTPPRTCNPISFCGSSRILFIFQNFPYVPEFSPCSRILSVLEFSLFQNCLHVSEFSLWFRNLSLFQNYLHGSGFFSCSRNFSLFHNSLSVPESPMLQDSFHVPEFSLCTRIRFMF